MIPEDEYVLKEFFSGRSVKSIIDRMTKNTLRIKEQATAFVYKVLYERALTY